MNTTTFNETQISVEYWKNGAIAHFVMSKAMGVLQTWFRVACNGYPPLGIECDLVPDIPGIPTELPRKNGPSMGQSDATGIIDSVVDRGTLRYIQSRESGQPLVALVP
jgi:hypothetical protein